MSGLHFSRVVIRRMLGVTEGFEIDGLARGVNVVFGPNASGKTTTARALEALLWPRTADGATTALEGVADLAGDRWSIRVDTGHVEYQQNGAPAASLPTAPVENRDRYRLWLPDLLRADDADFARKILIESSGGFDLEVAARSLQPKRPTHRQRQQQQELRRSRERVAEARRVQESVASERATLAEKEARLAGRAMVEGKLRLLRTAADHAHRRDESEAARAALEALPAVLGRIRGDEAAQVASWRSRIREAEAERGSADAARTSADRQLRRLGLPRELVDGDLIHRLQADLDRLGELDREIAECERACRSASDRLTDEGAALGSVLDPARLATLDLSGLDRLGQAVEALDAAREKARHILAEIAALPGDDASGDTERLRHGAFLLRQWLAAGHDDRGESRYLRMLATGSAIALSLTSIGLLFSGSLLTGGVGLACAALVVLALQKIPRKLDSRPDLEREYLHLNLIEAPDSWDAPPVIRCLEGLEDQVVRISEAERTHQRRGRLEARLAESEREEAPAAEQLQAVAAEFGLDPWREGVKLFWLVERISRWQRARAEKIGAEASLVAACAEQRALLESANGRLSPLGLEAIREPRALRGTVEKLRADLLTHQEQSRVFREALRRVEVATSEIERLGGEIEKLFDRTGLTEEDEPMLADLCGRADEHRRLLRAYEVADGQRQHLEHTLRALPGFEDILLLEPADILSDRIVEAERENAVLRALAEEVGSLRARVAAATEGHALEDALASEERCREEVLALRSRELRAAVEAVLIEYVERETRSEHLPDVFHRANELFNRITRGAYELRVVPGDEPSFRAYDTRLERGYALEELSSGTRVQLLIAVRIAFVECLEAGVALPLLMDETLANSDDDRSAAIMDAIIQLAAGGRQIFYFTAQPDEVAKWSRALQERPDVESRRFDLGEIRDLEQRLDFDRIEAASVGPSLPPPFGVEHREYGKRLTVPRIDLHAPMGALHLWYLVEQTELLHHLLADLQVRSWGELRSLEATGGALLLEPAVFGRIQAFAEIAEAALARIRIGRGRPVDRRALAASGAVSDRFINEVEALAANVDGDAEALLEALEARGVAKFQSRNIEGLREHLEREGHLDPRQPVNVEVVRRQIVNELSTRTASLPVTLAEVDRLLARIATGAGFPLKPRRPTTVSTEPQLWDR